MTAINVFLKRESAMMLTDAAMYTVDGTVVGFGQKAVAMPTLKSVIAVRGNQMATAALAMELALLFDSFDHMAENAETHLHQWFHNNVMAMADRGVQDCQIVIAGWSQKQDGPSGFVYDSLDDEGQPFERIEGDLLSPMNFGPRERLRLQATGSLPWQDFSPEDFDPIRHGIPLIEAQRRLRPDKQYQSAGSLVGGNILLTEVTRDGIQQRVIHRWKDVAGRKIIPDDFRLPPIPGTTRQSRRAFEETAAALPETD